MEQLIKDILADNQQVDRTDELIAIVDEHPSFVFLAAMLLRHASSSLSSEHLDWLRATVALGSADRHAMLDLADMSGFDWHQFYPMPKVPAKKSTDDTIDDFIAVYGHSSPEEDCLIERLIFNPVAPDYFQGLDEPLDPTDPLALPPELAQQKPEAASQPMAPQEQKAEKATPPPYSGPAQAPQRHDQKATPPPYSGPQPAPAPQNHGQTAAEVPESPLLMESLAKMFIKQRRYERALEIINSLSLNNPEKSVYFADQIRFLQKLIYIEHKKNKA